MLTDLGMPELDGYALANFLREQHTRVPVIAMTAYATEEDYRRCEQVGVAEVVLKPLSIAVLDAVLRRHAGAGEHAAAGREPARRDEPPAMSDEIRETLRTATLQSMASIDAALARRDLATIGVELHSMRGGFALAAIRSRATRVRRWSVRSARMRSMRMRSMPTGRTSGMRSGRRWCVSRVDGRRGRNDGVSRQVRGLQRRSPACAPLRLSAECRTWIDTV